MSEWFLVAFSLFLIGLVAGAYGGDVAPARSSNPGSSRRGPGQLAPARGPAEK